MKKLLFLITLMITAAATHLHAASLSVENLIIQAGQNGQLAVSMTNTETNLSGFQFRLYLPEGLSIATNDKGKFQYTLGDRIENHSLTIKALNDGVYQFIAYSMDGDVITGTSGVLLSVPVVPEENFVSGNGTISDIRLTDLDANKTTCSNVSFTITKQAVPATGITLSQSALSFTAVNQTATLTATVTPANATNKNVRWSSSNTNVATVSNTGVVTSIADGTATITATTADGTNLSVTCAVTVAIPIPATDINFVDANVKAICVANWDTNGDGELSETEAAAVTSLGEVFKDNTTITSFDELQYFTGLTTMDENAFYGCSELASVTIPNSVTSIGDYAFKDCSGLTSITIPESVTSIGRYAFSWCSGLTSINIPNSVTSIGSSAFYGCSGLTSITIPNSVMSIGEDAFGGCSGLTSISVDVNNSVYDSRNNCNAIIETATNTLVSGCKNTTIPVSVTSIGWYAFHNCSDLKSVTIPNSVTSIDGHAFQSCSGLTSITIPNSVTSIGEYAFEDCSGLTSITIPNSVTSIGAAALGRSGLTSISIDVNNSVYDSRNNCNAIIETATNTLVFGCKNTTIPVSVTSIGDMAFYYCSGLTSITIPESVTNIGRYAFYSCSSLTSVHVYNSNPVSIAYDTFSNRANATLYVPKGAKAAYEAADYWKEFKEIVGRTPIINFADANVKAICVANWDTNGDGELDEDEAAAVTSLGEVFKDNTTITSFDELRYFTGLTTMNENAFYGCSGLTSIIIPNSVTSIGNYAFGGCTSLPVIDNLRYADTYLLGAVDKTQSTYIIKEGTKFIGLNAFMFCSNLTSISIPNSVTSIGLQAFDYCSNLTTLTIPESVTSIDINAFDDCPSLTSISVASGNTKYDSRDNCNAIIETATNTLVTGCKNTVIPNNVTSIGDWGFCGCSSLTSITIPESVTSIGIQAFSECSGLTSITIPNSVTNIGIKAFEECSSLTSVTCFAEEVPTTGSSAFYEVPQGTATLYVPAGSVDAYKAAEQWKDFGTIRGFVLSGKCGNDVDFVLTDDYTLTISGTGDMFDYEEEVQPWEDYKTQIKNVVIEEGVTSIGAAAFSGCSGFTSVTLPSSLTSTGNESFLNCTGLTAVHISDLNAFCRISFGWYAPLYYAHRLYLNGEEVTGEIVFPDGITSVSNVVFEGCTGITSVVIPEGVTSIGRAAFKSTNITSVSLPESLTSIGIEAFQNCVSLTSVTIPESVTTISERAFSGSSGLTSVAIPGNVTNIGNYSFDACKALTSVVISDGVTSIGNGAFRECNNLASLVIPNSVTSIGNWAFERCINLTSCIVPENVVALGNGVFLNCTGLLSVIIPDGVTAIQERTFEGCNKLTSVKISKNAISIGWRSFIGCTELESIVIPASVESIGDVAFSGCSSLTSVENLSETPQSISSGTFSNRANATLYVPSGTKSAYEAAQYWNEFKEIIEQLPEGSTFVAKTAEGVDMTFKVISNSEMTCMVGAETQMVSAIAGDYQGSITIPESVNGYTVIRVGEWAFWSCSGLTSINIPGSVTSIGDLAFNACSSLTSITIPNSVTSIGGNAFAGCSGLMSISVASGNTKYDSRNNCDAIIETESNTLISGCKKTVIPESVASIGESAFGSCSGLTSITIPNSVTSIDTDAFGGCSGLTSITIPNSVTSIGNHAFSCCTSLTSIDIPNSVTSMGDEALSYCYALTSATIGNSVTSIGRNAFFSCSSLKSVTIGNSVTSIGESAFVCCYPLESVTIPESVTSIGDYAFSGCSRLTSVTCLAENVPETGESVFSDVAQSNATLYVPESSVNAYKAAEQWKEFGMIKAYGIPVATSIALNKTETTLKVGAQEQLTATVLPEEAEQAVTWKSSDPTVATVDENGLVTAVAPGSATITAATTDGTKLTATCEVTVEDSAIPGDVNGDGNVNGADIVAVINYVLADDIAGDVNGDGNVNGADIVAVINYVLNYPGGDARETIAQSRAAAAEEPAEILSGTKTEEGISLSLTGGEDCTAFQFMLSLPEGVSLTALVGSEERLGDHELLFRRQEDGRYLVLGFAMDNHCIGESSGELLSLLLSGNANGRATVSEALIFTPQAETRCMNALEINLPTAVSGVRAKGAATKGDIYDLSGRKLNQKPSNGYYIQGGKKYFVK